MAARAIVLWHDERLLDLAALPVEYPALTGNDPALRIKKNQKIKMQGPFRMFEQLSSGGCLCGQMENLLAFFLFFKKRLFRLNQISQKNIALDIIGYCSHLSLVPVGRQPAKGRGA
ncbi:hypothetical protein [Gloeobacter kilaueensis]|uniref:hypothetical protein n=1 Tax=Gloeobacter kilaueensis TaxID=1416614 RepID=UPI0016515B2F|nr:hypothetical protein [Gloeobacter kilaueensis]